MWDRSYFDDLKDIREKSRLGGGSERIARQHASGKLTAHERIAVLLDENSFVEVNSLVESAASELGMSEKHIPGDGVVTGYGTIHGRTVFVSAQDFTVIGGTLGEAHAKKICHIMDMALMCRAPFICINDSGGARIEEGVSSLDGYSGIFYRNTLASGVIPQISVILGPCAGGACYSPAISDFIFMSRETAKMFITGPNVVKVVTGEEVGIDRLGGSTMHEEISGVAHFVYDDDAGCLKGVRELLAYLPDSNEKTPPAAPAEPVDHVCRIEQIVPDNQKRSYDVTEVIRELVDGSRFLEVQSAFAKNIVIGFARMDGRPVGIVANQPRYMSGCLDINASDKAARFVRFCDCFGIPLLTLVDVPGFLPGTYQEQGGIIRHGAKLLYAFSEATVPKLCLIMRKAYGGAYIAMNSKNLGADLVLAWPIAQIAVMGAEGAVDIICKNELRHAPNPSAVRDERIEEYNRRFMNPYVAAKRGYINEVVTPEETRERLIRALDMLKDKKPTAAVRKKHGNIPL